MVLLTTRNLCWLNKPHNLEEDRPKYLTNLPPSIPQNLASQSPHITKPDDESHEGGHNHSEPPIFNDKQLSTLIDPVLREDDRNNDGMIDYAEFISAQIRTERGEKPVIQVSV